MPQLGEEPLLLDCTVGQKSNTDRTPTPEAVRPKGFCVTRVYSGPCMSKEGSDLSRVRVTRCHSQD